MADPRGFLTIGRAKVPRRPVSERVHDYGQVYLPLSQPALHEQAARCMSCGVPFCSTGCPLHNLIPEWNDLVHRDQWRAAIDRLHATNNFPEFTGALCPAPCEDACVLTINDDAVNIKEIERSIIEYAFDHGWVIAQPPAQRTGKRVAIVGSGPAGLAAAQQLNRAGHHVTVYEKDDTIGGLLVYGIPDFKIEKWIVERRVKLLEAEGVEFHTNTHVGVTIHWDALRCTHDAVLLAVGALAGQDLDLPGRSLSGIHLAMDYLVEQNRRVMGQSIQEIAEVDEITASDKRVVIIGGGDTGADCLGNVHRQGCSSVQILTRGHHPPITPDPLSWPDVAFKLRTWPAHEEGGTRTFDVLVKEFTGSNGRVEAIHMADAARPHEKHTLDADLVLLAIGFSGPVHDELFAQMRPQMTRSGAIHTDGHYQTSVPGVFAAGDAMRGASLIVWAIADGRRAARAIDEALMGLSLLPD